MPINTNNNGNLYYVTDPQSGQVGSPAAGNGQTNGLYYGTDPQSGQVGSPAAGNGQTITPTLYNDANQLVDPGLDDTWGGLYNGQAANPYYNYFFSGQDIKVFIDGTEDDPTYGNLPINGFMFTAEQQTQAFYGFWSYTMDALARGRRSVFGEFTIYSRSPDFMMQAIALSAKNRAANNGPIYDTNAPLSQDEANITQYWGNNLDPALTGGAVNLFSTAPIFNFVIVYGVQDISIGANASTGAQALQAQYQGYNGDDLMALNTNDRLVPASPDPKQMRIILDSVWLHQMNTQYDSTGQPIMETYQFHAKDIIYPTMSTS